MALKESIRKLWTSEKKSIYLQSDGRPKTIISTTTGKVRGMTPKERNESLLKKFWDYYQNEGTIFAAVNTTAWNTVMVGFNLVSDNVNAKNLIQSYLDRLDIDLILLDNVIYTLIYGDAFIEIVRNSSKDITALKTVDPTTMIINYDQYGIVTDYQQKIQGQLQKTILKPEDIIHIRFFSNPTNPYGISLIQPSMDNLDRKIATDESLANAIERHGTAKYLVKVGDKEEFPPESVFEDIKTELEDITSINEIIVPGLVDISVIDEKGIPGVAEYSDTFQKQLIIGLLCPEEALGLGRGSTEATATVKQMMYERMIRAFQLRLANQVRQEVINQILLMYRYPENIVKIRFNSVTDADEAVKAKWLGNLLRGYYPEEGKPFTMDEVRAMFGYSELPKGGVTPSQQPTGQPTNPPPQSQEPQPQEPTQPQPSGQQVQPNV
jgi:hypothetical protein